MCSFMIDLLLSSHSGFVYTNICKELSGHLAPVSCTCIIILIYGIVHSQNPRILMVFLIYKSGLVWIQAYELLLGPS